MSHACTPGVTLGDIISTLCCPCHAAKKAERAEIVTDGLSSRNRTGKPSGRGLGIAGVSVRPDAGERALVRETIALCGGDTDMSGMMLTKHESEIFKSQTVMLSGHAYIECRFALCTLVLTNTPTVLNGCHFEGCNWRLEYDVLWGDPNTRRNIRQILDLIDGAGTGDLSTEVH